MSNVIVEKSKIDILANAISAKSGEPVTMTLDEMVEAVDGIDTSGIVPTGNVNISQAGQTNVTQYATATVPAGTEGTPSATKGTVSNHAVTVTPSVTNASGWIDGGTHTGTAVTVSASELVSGTYTVDSSGTKDVTNYASASVPSGTAGTPSASKGSVSNHAISVTPSVTNTTGWITGSTKTGTAVSVSASELVSGTYTVTSAGTKDVTNYASASIASGTEGTPSATKGTVSNHSVSVTPSVTNVAGWISGGTKTGTAVTVSASELVSGSDTVTTNDTYDVTNLAELVVNVPSSGGVTVTDVANTTGITCVITSGSAPSEDIPLNTQLIDFTAVKNGYVVDGTTGEETASQWSSCSDYTLIDPSMTFDYIGYQWYDIVFYDSSKGRVGSIAMYQDSGVVITNDYAHGTLTPAKIPSTAKYVRINSYPTNPTTTQLSLIRTA